MNFIEAISALENGDKVRRAAWVKGVTIASPAADYPIIGSLLNFPWQPTLSDLTATDWAIHVPQPGEQ